MWTRRGSERCHLPATSVSGDPETDPQRSFSQARRVRRPSEEARVVCSSSESHSFGACFLARLRSEGDLVALLLLVLDRWRMSNEGFLSGSQLGSLAAAVASSATAQGRVVVDGKALATLLGVHRRTVDRWKLPRLQARARGSVRYDLTAVLQFLSRGGNQ